MQAAWEKRSRARDVMNKAFERKQKAYDTQNGSWNDYQAVRNNNGPRIDVLNVRQESDYQNMRSSFESATTAHDRRDGASAKSYAEKGHAYKASSQQHVAERRRLVAEIQSARARHEATKPAFQQAKAEFIAAKQTFDRAKTEHERTQAEFRRYKTEFDTVRNAFKSRLEIIKAGNKKRQDEKRAVAEKAGVPFQYLDSVWVSRDTNGNTNIYFGGVGKPDGLGHGHYVIDRNDVVTYKRDPFDPHGAQNFTEPLYWHKIKMSLDHDSGEFQTDNYIGIVGSTSQKTKAHIAVNADGDIVFVRDIGGEILYSRKKGIGYLPDDLDWSR